MSTNSNRGNIELSGMPAPECPGCGETIDTHSHIYCGNCRSDSTAEQDIGVHLGYEATDGTGWEQ